MTTNEKIAALRAAAKAAGADGVLIMTSDPHCSEYLPGYYNALPWFSGFIGENSTLVVTQTGSALWCDGRFYVQADKQLAGSEIECMHAGSAGVPTVAEYLESHFADGQTLLLDGSCVPATIAKEYIDALAKKGASLKSQDVASPIWDATGERPALPDTPCELLTPAQTGATAADRIAMVRAELQKAGATALAVTILSRCQRFAFKRLRPDEIASRLNFIAYQEHIEIEPEAINLLARLADGGMRDGVSLLDQCASAANGPVTLESVYASLGLAGEKRTAELMQAIAEQDTAKALTIFSALYSAGKDVSALLGEMCALCRDLLVLRTAPKSGLSMLSGIATEQQALALQSVFSPGELMRVLTETQKTRVSFGKNTDVRVAAELLLMQLCEPSLRLDAQALDARISRVEEQLASGVLVKSAPKASGGDAFDDDRPPFPDDADDPERGSAPPAQTQEQSSAAPQAETPVGFWPALSEKLRAALPAKISGFFAVNGPVHPVLQGDALIMATDTELVIDLVKKTPNTEALVREKASAILGKPVSVRFALKNRLSRLGDDPMDALVQFGQQHSDIFTIK